MTGSRTQKPLVHGRRAFLSGAAAVLLGASLRPLRAHAQATFVRQLVEVHHHFVTPHIIEALGGGATAPPGLVDR